MAEPTEIRINTSVTWKRELPDYGEYKATYVFLGKDGQTIIDTTSNGTTFTVNLAPDFFVGKTPGEYQWHLYVEKAVAGYERHYVESGLCELLADPLTEESYTTKSTAERILDAIDSTIEGKATKDAAELSLQTAHGSRAIKKIPITELLELRKHYSAIVRRELTFGQSHTIRVKF